MSSIPSEEQLQGLYDSKPDAHLAEPPAMVETDGNFLSLHRSLAGLNTPTLVFRGYGPKDFAPFESLLSPNTPRLLSAHVSSGPWEARFPECDAIQELRVVSPYSYPVLFSAQPKEKCIFLL
ncbi:hypothetical protein PC9H_002924 [Pleurotus ostreatus]|uniref:Uncharacterized protein n=1 Tax=Pleurotus ostreatus TaxID=5322 RepID=A0A8H6ZY18_PLEOS|nr:uncharacterized protein PC9H_002924 [Pleurotus ostreatus]KAF7436098.1 hypothetical protein PC9H_002924 [Pleurotus ostreatus]